MMLFVPLAVRAADHIVLSEVAVTPTAGEFVEIYNPTVATVDLSTYYLSDYLFRGNASSGPEYYWQLVNGSLTPSDDFPIDFLARFPDGTTIAPGQAYVISVGNSDGFATVWGRAPDFEIFQDGPGDGIPDMVDPGFEINGVPLIQSGAGLTNGRETVVLFHWDGFTDLVHVRKTDTRPTRNRWAGCCQSMSRRRTSKPGPNMKSTCGTS
jgi:hypothetical protein